MLAASSTASDVVWSPGGGKSWTACPALLELVLALDWAPPDGGTGQVATPASRVGARELVWTREYYLLRS